MLGYPVYLVIYEVKLLSVFDFFSDFFETHAFKLVSLLFLLRVQDFLTAARVDIGKSPDNFTHVKLVIIISFTIEEVLLNLFRIIRDEFVKHLLLDMVVILVNEVSKHISWHNVVLHELTSVACEIFQKPPKSRVQGKANSLRIFI